jgi:hypothetical protein
VMDASHKAIVATSGLSGTPDRPLGQDLDRSDRLGGVRLRLDVREQGVELLLPQGLLLEQRSCQAVEVGAVLRQQADRLLEGAVSRACSASRRRLVSSESA